MNMHKNTRLTPSLDLDILNGIMRQALLQQLQTYLRTPSSKRTLPATCSNAQKKSASPTP